MVSPSLHLTDGTGCLSVTSAWPVTGQRTGGHTPLHAHHLGAYGQKTFSQPLRENVLTVEGSRAQQEEGIHKDIGWTREATTCPRRVKRQQRASWKDQRPPPFPSFQNGFGLAVPKTALQSSVLKNRESVYRRNVSPPRARTRGYPPSSAHTALPCSRGPRGSAARSITTRPPWGRGGPPARWQVRGAGTGASEPVQGKRQNLNRFRRRDEPMALRFHTLLL